MRLRETEDANKNQKPRRVREKDMGQGRPLKGAAPRNEGIYENGEPEATSKDAQAIVLVTD